MANQVTLFTFAVSCILSPLSIESLSPLSRIIDGRHVFVAEFPYMVSIWYRNGLEDRLGCSGSIITPTCVLTAAHCAYDIDSDIMSVRAAVSSSKEKGVHRRLQFYEVHPDYGNSTLNSDVAILKLDKPLEGKHIKEIPFSYTELKDFETVLVSGFGLKGHADPHKDLDAVYVNIVPQKACQQVYKNLTDNMFCAKDEGKDACKFDSGGPVVLNGQQVGSVSWGPMPCAISDSPGVYVRFSSPSVHQFLKQSINDFCY